jgi:hypothetical protein
MSKQDRAVIIRDRDAFLKHVVGPRKDIKPNVKFMIAIMLTHIDAKTGECTVGAEKLATEMGCTTRHAERLLRKVKATGLVDWPKNKGGGSDKTNHFIFPGLQYGGNSASPTPTTLVGVYNGNPDQTAPSTPTKIEANPDQNDLQPRPLWSDVQVSQVSGLSQGSESEEDFKEEGGGNRETSGAERKKGAIRGTEIGVGTESANRELPLEGPFEEFWKIYPKSDRGDSKKAAWNEFVAVVKAGADPAAIIAGARQYAPTRKDPHFVKNPAKWLRDEDWKINQQPSSLLPDSSLFSAEQSVEHYAINGFWSGNGRIRDASQVDPGLMRKYGMLPDGRQMPTILTRDNIEYHQSVASA